jgi:outer membrane protein assembly factor BamB
MPRKVVPVRWRSVVLASLAFVLMLPAAGAQMPLEDVLFQRGDLGRSGAMIGPGPRTEPVLLWQKSFPGFLEAPLISDDLIVFGGGNGVIYGLDRDTGSWIWGSTLDGKIASVRAIVGGIVYASGYAMLGNEPGVYAAFTLETGAERWRYETDGNLTSAAMLASGSTLVLALPDPEGGDRNDQLVAAFHLTEEGPGDQLWSYPLGAAAASFAQSDGILVVSAGDVVRGFDLQTGDLAWAYTFAESAGAPAIADGIVVVPDNKNAVYHAIDLVTGEQLWGFHPNEFLSPAAVSERVTYIHGGEALFALDLETGDERWAYRGADDYGPPTISNGVVYAGAWVDRSTGAAIAIDAATGEELWRVETPANLAVGVPVVSRGTVYIADGMGTLYAIGGDSE